MTRFVLDASITLTWCFPDEESRKAEEISERIAADERLLVPAFWRHEMLNALLVGEKRTRLTPELTQAFINDLGRLPVDVDAPASSSIVFASTQARADDAAYLEVALREKHALATVDTDLRRAATAEGVHVL